MHSRTSQPQRRAGARPLTTVQPHYQPLITAAVEGFIPRALPGPDAYANLKAFASSEKKFVAPISPLEIFVPVSKPQPLPAVVVAEKPAIAPISKVELGPALATFLRTCLDDTSLLRGEVTAHQENLVCTSCQKPMARRRRVLQSGEQQEGYLFRCKDCGIITASGLTLPTIEGDLARAATNSPLLLSNGRPEPKQLLFVVDGETGTTVLDPVTLLFRQSGQWDRSFLYRVIKADDVAVELEPANIPAEGLISTNITVKRNASGDLELRVNPLRPARIVKWRLPVKGAQIGEFIEKLQRRDPLAIPVWFQVDAASGKQTLVQLEGAVDAAIEDPVNSAELLEAVSAAVVARGWFLEPLQPGSPPGTERVPLVDKSARAQQLRSVLASQLSATVAQRAATASA